MEHIEELAKEKTIDDSARPNDEHEKLAKEPAEIIDDSLRREALSMQAQFLNAARKSVPSAVEAATILGRTGQRVLSRISFGGADESTEPQAAVAEDYTLDNKILGEGIWGTVYKGSRLNAAGELEQVAIKKLDKKDKEGKEKQDASTQLVEMEKECRLNQFAHVLSKPATSSLGCARLEVRARHCAMVPRMHSYNEGTSVLQFVQGTTLEKYIRGPGYDENPKRQRSIEDVAFAAHLRSVCHVVVQKVCTLLLLGRSSEFSHRDLNDGNVMIDIKHTVDPTTSIATPSSDPEDIAVWMIDFGKSMACIDGERVRAEPFAEPAMTTAAHGHA
jgi:serine/threonine protein kinase